MEKRRSVLRTGIAYLGQAQRIADMHSVFRTGTAYRGQPHRIEDKHIALRTGTAYRGGLKTKNPIIHCQRDKTWRPDRWVHSKSFVKREDICLYTFWKTKERFVSTADISLVGTFCPTQREGGRGGGEGLIRISIDMVDRRIFLNLKFLIRDFFWASIFLVGGGEGGAVAWFK